MTAGHMRNGTDRSRDGVPAAVVQLISNRCSILELYRRANSQRCQSSNRICYSPHPQA